MGISEFLEARIAEDEEKAKLIAGTSFPRNHIQEWGPARVLAECAAKRTILALHPAPMQTDEDPLFPIEPATCRCGSRLPCSTLRALAAVYADHPDYPKELRGQYPI